MNKTSTGPCWMALRPAGSQTVNNDDVYLQVLYLVHIDPGLTAHVVGPDALYGLLAGCCFAITEFRFFLDCAFE